MEITTLLSPLIVLPFLAFIIITTWLYKTTQKTSLNTPPSPPKLPILGNLHQFDKLLHRSFRSFSQRYDIVVANRPKLRVAYKILYDGKDIAFANYGEYWRQMNSICTLHMFSTSKVRSFRRVREEEAHLMVQDIRVRAGSDEAFDLTDCFVRITNDVVCRAAFGRKYAGEEGCPNLKELLNDFSEALGSFSMHDFVPWLGWIDYVSGVDRKASRIAKALDEFIENVVQEHLDRVESIGDGEDGERVQDLVEVLLQIQRENASSLPKESSKAILLDMVAGGTDTTFTLLEWAMTELLTHPDAMKRVQDEVRNAAACKPRIDEDDLKNMDYLKAVIKETLRLHLPLPLLLFENRPRMSKLKATTFLQKPKSSSMLGQYRGTLLIGKTPTSFALRGF